MYGTYVVWLTGIEFFGIRVLFFNCPQRMVLIAKQGWKITKNGRDLEQTIF